MNTNVSRGSTPTAAEYLAVTSLTDGIFLIGLLDSGVTIFNQQLRALNLIWALDREKRLDSASAIAVVGGGIAGLTAAMALRKIFSLTPDSSNRKVTLFEKRSVLCPLQRGCATRWVHPHIYDWPAEGSTNPSAGLPIMNWRAGRASDVATTIVNEWEGEAPHNVEEWRNLRYLKIHHKSREVEWVGEKYESGQVERVRGDKRQFDIVILAIGFGNERDSTIRPAVSYWRNDPYAQPDLSGRQKRYLVSGTGDGGLVDLLRLRIVDFREDRTGHRLAPEGLPAYKEIQQLRTKCYAAPPSTQGADLFDQARELGHKHHLVDAINRRLRADTVVSLQVRDGQRVSDAFGGKSSFVNRFLVSLLFEAGGFSPRFGDLESIGADGFDEVIVRHGPDTDAHVKSIFSEDISNLLTAIDKKRLDQNETIGVSQRYGLWEPGWPLDRKAGTGPGSFKRDYVPEATIAVSSAFVSALAPVFLERGGNYRATLHRVVGMHTVTKELHLQQIAHYHGPRGLASSDQNVVGRLFKITEAVIGLAARSGRVLTTARPQDMSDDECRHLLREDMKRLGGENWDPQRMKDDVSSLFACPLIYKAGDVGEPTKSGRVVAVLFADSTKGAAFDERTVTQIVAACEEFGRYLQRIAESKATELISVKSQATSHSAEDDKTAELFKDFSLLTASSSPPPRVPVEYINLDWWT